MKGGIMDNMAELMQKGVVLAELQQALQIVQQAGYRVSKPKARRPANGAIATVNPLGHPYPHAKLYKQRAHIDQAVEQTL
jgi:hypothetical protein